MELIEQKNFDRPDETDHPWDKVTGDWVSLMGQDVGRTTVEPGWNWKEHAAPVAGTERCENFHVKLFTAGRFAVEYQDGTASEFGAGDIAVLQPGHDAWVVGDEPVIYYSLGGIFKAAAGS